MLERDADHDLRTAVSGVLSRSLGITLRAGHSSSTSVASYFACFLSLAGFPPRPSASLLTSLASSPDIPGNGPAIPAPALDRRCRETTGRSRGAGPNEVCHGGMPYQACLDMLSRQHAPWDRDIIPSIPRSEGIEFSHYQRMTSLVHGDALPPSAFPCRVSLVIPGKSLVPS